MPHSNTPGPTSALNPVRARSASSSESLLLDPEDSLSGELAFSTNLGHVRHLRSEVLSIAKAQRMAEFFSLLGDANRLRILSTLAKRELCVCDLAAVVNMSESAVSHQLRALRAMRLVGYRKQGRNVFYHLKDEHVYTLYREVAEHLDEPDEA